MIQSLLRHRAVWMGMGLVLGLALAQLWPTQPIQAVATAQQDNLIVATGRVDEEGEAVICLDALTGDLQAWVLSTQGGGFTSYYKSNVNVDLKVDPTKNPKYTLVTGEHRFRRGAGTVTLSESCIYVCELTTGRMVAYALPWNRAQRTSARAFSGALIPVTTVDFRNVVVRDP